MAQVKPVLSLRQYLDQGGNACPFCEHVGEVDSDRIQNGDDTPFADVTCGECGNTWQDLYQLAGFMYLDADGDSVEG